MLSSLLVKKQIENLEWLRRANKYAERTQHTDESYYKEYSYIMDILNSNGLKQRNCCE